MGIRTNFPELWSYRGLMVKHVGLVSRPGESVHFAHLIVFKFVFKFVFNCFKLFKIV